MSTTPIDDRAVSRAPLALAVLAALLTFVGCGPSPAEAATTVALLGPLVFATDAAFLSLLLLLWRRSSPDWIAPPWPLWTAVFVGHMAFAGLVALVGDPSGAVEWLPIGYWAFGTSHLAVALVVWRIWLFWDRSGAFVWGPTVASALLLLPALPMAAGGIGAEGDADLDGVVGILWMAPGYAGWVPGILFLLFLIEAGVRIGLVARRDRVLDDIVTPPGPAPDPLPDPQDVPPNLP